MFAGWYSEFTLGCCIHAGICHDADNYTGEFMLVSVDV